MSSSEKWLPVLSHHIRALLDFLGRSWQYILQMKLKSSMNKEARVSVRCYLGSHHTAWIFTYMSSTRHLMHTRFNYPRKSFFVISN
jgi:hypothetical protein